MEVRYKPYRLQTPRKQPAFSGVKKGFFLNAVDAGFPLQYDDFHLGRALSSVG
jgi:hypothetical protein